jgi:geranylgeranyl diphosphate synthase type I
LAFQAVDDLLGIWGDPEVTGKPVHGDLRRGKKTLPVVAAVERDPETGRRLADLLPSGGETGDVEEATLDEAARLIDAAGGRAFAGDQATANLDSAGRILDAAGLDGPIIRELAALCRFVVDRRH